MAAPIPVPIDQRFAQLIQQFGLTKNSFAMSLGKTASVVQHLIDGRNKPGYDLLCKVFEIYPNVSRDWLLLGRGPMLVSSEPVPKVAPQTTLPAAEPALEPIDLEEIEVPLHRRSGPGVAGTRLQPTEIAATLALAAAAAHPARAAAQAPVEAAPAEPVLKSPAVAEAPAFAAATATPAPNFEPQVATPAQASAASESGAFVAAAPLAPSSPAAPLQAAVAAVPGPGPETYVAAALHAQHLQHQLALAEVRNQHLLEQQQMLREMLAMARQAMV
ncbi:hypothetical protein [Hymenobacter sp. B1770]|uniref:hypothetical protein n=1 Tax=Hymenobacter sp. B1770 TaxID=1718788 RepID=UPI003CECB94D